MLAHFAPFSAHSPLSLNDSSAVDTFARAVFSKRNQDVMHNWEALHECEDEREAVRLKRRSSKLVDAKDRTHAVKAMLPAEYIQEPGAFALAEEDFSRLNIDNETLHLRCALLNADWLQANFVVPPSQYVSDPALNRLDDNLKLWQSHINQQVTTIANARRTLLDPSHQAALLPVHDTQSGSECTVIKPRDDGKGSDIPETRTLNMVSLTPDDWDKEIASIQAEFTLNKEQMIAFRIAAERFRQTLSSGDAERSGPPLKMIMTGPGGTGKTHVVNALCELMRCYNSSHKIRFLAPTGAAAVLIGGQTIHSGFGIKPQSKSRKSDADTNDDNSVQYTVSEKKKAELRAEWKNVDFVLIDEVSMVSAELLCDLDAVLRFAKERNEWFGGINIIFSGDFYQHRPVKQRSLIVPVKAANRTKKNSGSDTLAAKQCHGRIAWKQVDTVVELHQQKRMEVDKNFAKAVQNLRLRSCDEDDLALFNSCVIKGPENPHGVDLCSPEWANVTVLVDKNVTRRTLNEDKARVLTHGENRPRCVTCHAKHVERSKVVSHETHAHFLDDTEAEHPPMLSLYEGTPVILKQNICQELQIQRVLLWYSLSSCRRWRQACQSPTRPGRYALAAHTVRQCAGCPGNKL